MIKIYPSEAYILRALRAGEVDRYQLLDRFGASSSSLVSSLKRKGLAEISSGGSYKITALGHEHCPKRRPKKVAV